ncbi:hypothetical protein [Ruminococcus flavefaciens]|uniref:hypothetical protein n=1 Tax=Ruminococcus flavefaciens TaxID=1265 RepID=UPI000466B98F|nr:hypothetical protein [Ruminococcus flavefaciens]
MNEIKRIIALLTSFALFIPFLTSCSKKDSSKSVIEKETSVVTTKEIAEAITESIHEQTNDYTLTPVTISYNWEDYAGNLDAFVYGLLMNEYELYYTVFNAALELPDGSLIYGIGYTEFDDYFEDDEKTGYFPAGFISLIGEPEIPDELVETGLKIIDLDYEKSDYAFVYAYEPSGHMEHCVVWGQYLKYGITDKGQITYEASKYERGKCDESLGALYSYDESRYVFDPDVGDFTPINGVSLSEEIDFDALEEEINRILETQDMNFSQEGIESSVYFAHEALNQYLLSIQDETFMGYKVSELLSISQELNPMECIRITPNGIVTVDVTKDIPQKPDALTKWLVGITCGITIVACVAADLFIPALVPVTGAISGAAIEVFIQVVIDNQTVDNINWKKVAIVSAESALLAWACPALGAGAAKGMVKILGDTAKTKLIANITGLATKVISSSLVAGTSSASMAMIDGKTSEEVFDAFKTGAIIGASFAIGTEALGQTIKRIGPKAAQALQKVTPNKWLNKIRTLTEKTTAFIADHQIHLKNTTLEEILAPKSVFQATNSALNEIRIDKIERSIISELPSDANKNFIKLDSNGNIISKYELKQNGGSCIIKLSDGCDPELKRAFADWGISELPVNEYSVDFTGVCSYEFTPIDGISSNREKNMNNYYEQLANDWNSNPDLIPSKIREVLSDDQISNLNATNVKKALSTAKLTPHEGTDGKVYLVDSFIHSKVSHSGGVSWAKSVAMLEVLPSKIKELSQSSIIEVKGTLLPKVS